MKSEQNNKQKGPLKSFGNWLIRTKKGIALLVVLILFATYVSAHELAIRYYQNVTCTVCHEMSEPVRKWQESGTAKNHPNCASCHFEEGIEGWWELNKSAVVFFVEHFKRDPNEEIKPPEEPLFIDLEKEPGYYSLVPNHRCFTCKDVTNDQGIRTHTRRAQIKIHSEDIDNILEKPCKDCHNHEMRKGQTFSDKESYENIDESGGSLL